MQCQTFDGCEKKINPKRKNCYKAKILNHTDGGENQKANKSRKFPKTLLAKC